MARTQCIGPRRSNRGGDESVAQVAGSAHSESRRMELRAVIRLSSEIIAYYWPMRTFVHHNPLHGLEDYPFAEAVRHGERILGGRGYLSLDIFHDYYRSG